MQTANIRIPFECASVVEMVDENDPIYIRKIPTCNGQE